MLEGNSIFEIISNAYQTARNGIHQVYQAVSVQNQVAETRYLISLAVAMFKSCPLSIQDLSGTSLVLVVAASMSNIIHFSIVFWCLYKNYRSC
jgi:hypothetical protein